MRSWLVPLENKAADREGGGKSARQALQVMNAHHAGPKVGIEQQVQPAVALHQQPRLVVLLVAVDAQHAAAEVIIIAAMFLVASVRMPARDVSAGEKVFL